VQQGSPYEILIGALLNAATYNSATLDSTVALVIDGNIIYEVHSLGQSWSPLLAPSERQGAPVWVLERLLSLLAGDLKNNVYLVSHGGLYRVELTLTQRQLPEFLQHAANAGTMDDLGLLAATGETREDYEGYQAWELPVSSLVLDQVQLQAEINQEGQLLSLRLGCQISIVNIFGELSFMEYRAEFVFSNIT